MEIEQVRKSLPIYSARGRLISNCREHYSLVIVGETGSGKTTQLPQVILSHCCYSNLI